MPNIYIYIYVYEYVYYIYVLYGNAHGSSIDCLYPCHRPSRLRWLGPWEPPCQLLRCVQFLHVNTPGANHWQSELSSKTHGKLADAKNRFVFVTNDLCLGLRGV